MKVKERMESARKRDACADQAEQYRLQTDDLIQQTRAADAAQAQAVLAYDQGWVALWATLGGLWTLIAASLAAAYARDAAIETKRSANAAHEANRPWLQVEVIESKRLVITSDSAELTATIKITNLGNSPALYVNARTVLYAERGNIIGTLPQGATNKAIDWLRFRSGSLKDIEGATLFPGASRTEDYISHIAWDEVKGAIDAKSVFLSFAAGVIYHFGESTGRTVTSFEIWPDIGDDRKIPIPKEGRTDLIIVNLLDNLASFAD